MSPPLALLIALIGVLAGVGLIVLGVRGRRIDDHPTCARCRFDLSVTPRDADRCPECGIALHGFTSILVGRRRRIPGMIGAGGLLLVATVPMLALLAWAGATGFNWNTIKPVGWLVRDAASADTGVAGAAQKELNRRLYNSKLSQREIGVVTDRALAIQRDPGAQWSDWWGQFIWDAASAKLLPASTWQEYARHFAPLRLEYDIAYAQGDSIGFDLVADEARIAQVEHWWVNARLDEFRILDASEPVPVEVQLRSKGRWINASRSDLRYRYPFSVTADLEPGLYRVELTWTLRAAGPNSGSAYITDRVHDAMILKTQGREIQRSFDDYVNASWTRTATIPMVILPREYHRPVGACVDPIRAQVDDCLRHVSVAANPVPHGKTAYVRGEFVRAPCDIVFDVWLETMGGEPPLGQRWFVSHVAVRRGETSRYVVSNTLEEEFDAPWVDVVFRPCWLNAEMRAGISNIWSETIIRRRKTVRWRSE